MNTQKSESKMLSNVEKRYGGPKLTNVIIGDYDKPNNPKEKELKNNKIRSVSYHFLYNKTNKKITEIIWT